MHLGCHLRDNVRTWLRDACRPASWQWAKWLLMSSSSSRVEGSTSTTLVAEAAAAAISATTLSLCWAQRQTDDIILVVAGIRAVQPEPGGAEDSATDSGGNNNNGHGTIIIIIISLLLAPSGLQLVSLAALSVSFVCLALSPAAVWPTERADWGTTEITFPATYPTVSLFFFLYLSFFTTRVTYTPRSRRCRAARNRRDPLQASAEIALNGCNAYDAHRIRRYALLPLLVPRPTHALRARQHEARQHALQNGLGE